MGRFPGLNEPCSCGSGRKYKSCCEPTDREAGPDQPTAAERGIASEHALDQRLTERLLRYARDRFDQAFFAGVTLSYPGLRADVDQLFGPWALYLHRHEGKSLADWFLAEQEYNLTTKERRWLDLQRATPVSIWEVTDVEPGIGMNVHDRLTDERCFVDEVGASRTVQRHMGLLARICQRGSRWLMVGLHARPLPPIPLAAVVDDARQLLGCGPSDRPTAAALNSPETAHWLMVRWQQVVEELDSTPPPSLQNTDGDELLLTTEHFAFSPADRAQVVAKIANLRGSAAMEDSDSHSTVFTLTKQSTREPSELVMVARIEVLADRLRVETNSRKRSDLVRRQLERAMGPLVTRGLRVQTDPEKLARAPAGQRREPPPGAAQALRAYKEQHYATWPDHPLPALAGKTPRDAARDPRQRDALAALLKEMEQFESRLPQEERADFANLWRLLEP